MRGTITDEISAVNQALAENVGPQKFRIWFENSTKLTLTDDYLKISVPNLFTAGWIESHFLNQIKQALSAVTGTARKVTFAIDPELSGQQKNLKLPVDADSQTHNRNSSHEPPDKMQKLQSKALRLTLETFVVGPSNQLAYNAARAVISQNHSPFNPLFIHGGYGVGKTHLLQGICNAVSQKCSAANWLYLSAEDFANQFILALKTKKIEQFRHKIRETDLLAIDDIHFFAGKNSTQEEFLHTFNTIDLAGKQVVLVSDAHPRMIGQLSEKLVSRFVAGMVVKIENPDFQTRCGICQQYAKAMGQNLPQSVTKYTAEKLKTNVRELQGALLKLVAFASLQNTQIDLDLAKHVLAEHLARTDPIVHISDIESAVADYFGLMPANIRSSKKNKIIAMARHFSMYLARKHTKMSLAEIGRFMGNKNHATVLAAYRKIEDCLKQNLQLYWQGPAGNKVAKTKTILDQLEETISA